MRITLGNAMPCGCQPLRNCEVIGIDGARVKLVVWADTDIGQIGVRRFAIEPQTRGERGVDVVTVEAPFELRCRHHGPLSEVPL